MVVREDKGERGVLLLPIEKEVVMNKILLSSVLAVGLLGIGTTAQAANPMNEKEASPTLKERLTKDTIKGTLMRTEGEYKSTKLDKVLPGDMVKAYGTDQRHTTTVERVN